MRSRRGPAAAGRFAALCTPALVLAGGLLGGCGFGDDGEGSGGAVLRVTRDFGRVALGSVAVARVPEGETAGDLLRSKFRSAAGPGGAVRSIGGLEARGDAGWFLFVNGLDAGEAAHELSPGDRVQWDYRSTAAAPEVPAIVGAFPEPLLHGSGGKRRPVRLECDAAASAPCEEADERLRAARVFATRSTLGAPGTQSVTRVVVGLWPRVRVTAAMLAGPPRESGVFARFVEGGRELQLLADDGEVARTVRAGDGTGLVAAVRPREDELVWLVTALDERGLAAAASALTRDRLRDAYAVAVAGRVTETLPRAGR